MELQEVANKYVEYCRNGQYEQCQNELYHENAVSIEPKGAPLEVANGLEMIKEKGRQWQAMVEEVHSVEISDPVCGGNHFSCSMDIDVTYKGAPRSKMSEVCVYEVQDGKIVKEQFFFPSPPQQG